MNLSSFFALVPTLGVLAQWLAWRTRLPAILLLLGFGILLGQFVSPDALIAESLSGKASAGPNFLFPLVSLAVAIVLFEGGLSLRWLELREAGSPTIRLVTVGAAITMLLSSLMAHWLLRMSWEVSILLGAILTVTGPTVIGPLLQQIRPSRRVAATLKWEGIVIDPIGAVLAVLVFEQILARGGSDAWDVMGSVWLLIRILAVGVLIGVAGGIFLTQAIRRYWIPDSLQGVVTLSVVLLLFVLSNQLAEESGLIAVTIIGMWLANRGQADIGQVIEFKEHLRTLLIGCLFIILGSRLNLQNLVELGWRGGCFLLAMIAIVRPVSVYLAFMGSSLSWKEQTFFAFVAPRGIVAAAVSSLFALKMIDHQETAVLKGVHALADTTFLVIIGTVTFYGLMSGWVARRLGLSQSNPQGLLIAGADLWVRELATIIQQMKVTVLLVDTNYNKVAMAKMAGLPAECVNILSDHAMEELDLGGIGRLLAMTPNDEVNSLAIKEFRHVFDSSDTYQLSFTKNEGRRALSGSLSGRLLFEEGLTFSRIKQMHESGSIWKKTKLTPEFDWQAFKNEHADRWHLLAVVDEVGGVKLNTVDQTLNPTAGQTVIALIEALPKNESIAAS